MYNQKTRYYTTIFTLDRISSSFNLAYWDNDTYSVFLDEEYKHTGLHLINELPLIYIHIEYLNIIWDYKVFMASFKEKYQKLNNPNDDRWKIIEEKLYEDLKTIGLEELIKDIISSLKKINTMNLMKKEIFNLKNIVL